jgi:SAM-dependent methyltransferase
MPGSHPPDICESRRLLVVVGYARKVTPTGRDLRDRLYEAYASDHASCASSDAAALVYRRDIRPVLPAPGVGPVVDIGCGQGQLLRLLLRDGYQAEGVDISPEQVALGHAAGLRQIVEGDYRDFLAERSGRLAAVVATDLLEHMAKEDVLDTFDRVACALTPGGVFVARVPNAVSPFGGNIRYGDFTHESWFTARSVSQLATAAGFASVSVAACTPIAHGVVSAVRVVVWKAVSGLCKVALAAETGAIHGHVVTQNLTFIAHKGRATG